MVVAAVVAAAVAAAVAVAVGITGIARADDAPSHPVTLSSTAPATPPAPSHPGPGPGHGRGWGPGGAAQLHAMGSPMLTDLAGRLGVDTSTLRSALKRVRTHLKDARSAAKKPGQQRPDPSVAEAAFAKALADDLGLPEQKVADALTAIRDERQRAREQRLSDRLDHAVQDGTLTQGEADAVRKAVKEGIIPMGGPPRP